MPGIVLDPAGTASLRDLQMWEKRERMFLCLNPNLVNPIVYDTLCGMATDMFLDKNYILAHATIARMLLLAPVLLGFADAEDECGNWPMAVWELANPQGDYAEMRKLLDMHIACDCLRQPHNLCRQAKANPSARPAHPLRDISS